MAERSSKIYSNTPSKLTFPISLGNYNHFALYGSYVESIMEYKIWQDMYYKDNKENYFSYLYRMGYAPNDKLYNYKLRQIMKNEKFKDLFLHPN